MCILIMFKESCKNELNKTRFITYKLKNKSKQPNHLVKNIKKNKSVHFVNLFKKFNIDIETSRKFIKKKNPNLSQKIEKNKIFENNYKKTNSSFYNNNNSNNKNHFRSVSVQNFYSKKLVHLPSPQGDPPHKKGPLNPGSCKSTNKHTNKTSLNFYQTPTPLIEFPFTLYFNNNAEESYNEEINQIKNDYIKKMLTTHKENREYNLTLRHKKLFSLIYKKNKDPIPNILNLNKIPLRKNTTERRKDYYMKINHPLKYKLFKLNNSEDPPKLCIKPFYFNNFSDPKYFKDNYLISNILNNNSVNNNFNCNKKIKINFVHESCSCSSKDLIDI